jgi:two-component system, NtrC family, response regulator AtoC
MSTNIDSMPSLGLTSPRVLLVSDDPFETSILEADLSEAGCEVEVCGAGRRLDRLLERGDWDAILSDQETAAVDRFETILARPDPPVLVLLAGFGSIDDAVEAVRAGAADYLSKPISGDQLRHSLGRALEQRELRSENRRLREDLGERYELGNLKSRSPEMQRIFETVRTVADTKATILIQGESGTGKTLLARSIHRHSSRSDGPFVEVNCGALPDGLLESELFGHVRGAFTGAIKDRPGKFEIADGGTIFLDEIACASPDLQVKLLRVLQDRELERLGDSLTRKVDVRVIAACNQPLREEIEAGRFREDLFYRLHVLGLEVPPLRERPGDVVMLAEHFLGLHAREYGRSLKGFDDDVLPRLSAYPWPGNVRELENALERAVLLCRGERIGTRDLPPEISPGSPSNAAEGSSGTPSVPPELHPGPLRSALEKVERDLIKRALDRHRGSRKATAAELEINRTTLFNKMKKYNLMDLPSEDPDESRTSSVSRIAPPCS